MKLNKAILVPLISAVLIFVKDMTGYQLPDGTADLAADLIMLAITSSGIFIHPKSSEKAEVEDHAQYPDHTDAV